MVLKKEKSDPQKIYESRIKSIPSRWEKEEKQMYKDMAAAFRDNSFDRQYMSSVWSHAEERHVGKTDDFLMERSLRKRINDVRKGEKDSNPYKNVEKPWNDISLASTFFTDTDLRKGVEDALMDTEYFAQFYSQYKKNITQKSQIKSTDFNMKQESNAIHLPMPDGVKSSIIGCDDGKFVTSVADQITLVMDSAVNYPSIITVFPDLSEERLKKVREYVPREKYMSSNLKEQFRRLERDSKNPKIIHKIELPKDEVKRSIIQNLDSFSKASPPLKMFLLSRNEPNFPDLGLTTDYRSSMSINVQDAKENPDKTSKVILYKTSNAKSKDGKPCLAHEITLNSSDGRSENLRTAEGLRNMGKNYPTETRWFNYSWTLLQNSRYQTRGSKPLPFVKKGVYLEARRPDIVDKEKENKNFIQGINLDNHPSSQDLMDINMNILSDDQLLNLCIYVHDVIENDVSEFKNFGEDKPFSKFVTALDMKCGELALDKGWLNDFEHDRESQRSKVERIPENQEHNYFDDLMEEVC